MRCKKEASRYRIAVILFPILPICRPDHATYFKLNIIFNAVYHVGPNGWTQVWAGDTTDMFYKYYPLKNTKSIETEEEKKAQQIAAVTFGHGA